MSYKSGGTIQGPLRFVGTASPGNSSSGEGRIYYDSVAQAFLVSQNGGNYVTLGTASLQQSYTAGGPGGGAITLTLSGGPIALSNPMATGQPAFTVTQNNPAQPAAVFNSWLQLSKASADPSSAANQGFLYTKNVSSVTQLFYEASDGTINQLTPSSGGSSSLQSAYNGGNTISESPSTPVVISNANADGSDVVQINRAPGSSSAGNGLTVDMGVNATGLAALFEGASISCLDTGFASERHGFNANATGDFSSSFGNGAQATGASSVAIGATGGYAVACFYHNNSAGNNQTNTRFASSSNLGTSFGNYSLPATTIAAGSDGQSLPQATIFVASTTEFDPSGGTLLVQTSGGTQTVSYTGVTGGPTPSFTGCSGGSGTMSAGGFVGGAQGTLHQTIAAVGSTLYAAFVDPNLGNVDFITSTDGGRTWSTPVVANPGGEDPLYTSISTFDGVTIYISYWEGNSRTLKLLKSTNSGATWSASTIDDGSGGTNNVGEFNAIKALDNSHVFVAYWGRTLSQALLAISADGGGTWNLSVVGTTSSFSNVDDINVVDANTVYVPFQQTIVGVKRPVLGITTNAQNPTPSWTIHQVDSTVANQNSHLSVDSRDNGATIWVAYNNITNGVRVAKSTNGGASWSHVAVDAGSTTGQSLKLRALPGSDTEVFVVYAQNNQSPNNGLWIGVSSDGGSSWSTHAVDPNPGNAGQHPSLAFPLGASATASGQNSTAVGAGASSPNSGDVAVGVGSGVSSGTGTNSTSIGTSATSAGGNTVSVGAGANATGASGVAIGQNSTSGASSVSVGGSSTGVANSVVVGVAAVSSGAGVVIGSSAQNNASGRSVVLGPSSVISAATTGTNVLIGPSNTTQGAADHAVYLVGDTLTNLDIDGTTKLSNVLIVGGNNAAVKDVYFGAGPSNTTALAVPTTVHASGGGATVGAGNDLILAGGKGFNAGSDAGGSVRIKVANTGASHTLVDGFFVDGNSNVVLGASGAGLATGAVNGFSYLPTTTIQPTGVPAQLTGAYAGGTPIIVGTSDQTIWGYVGGQWVSLGGGGSSEKIVPYTADAALTNQNAGETSTNTGATGQVTLTLPAITVGKVFLFAVTDAQMLVIAPFDNTSTINLGTTTGTLGGSVSSDLVGSMLRIVAVSSTQWFAEIVTGEWTPS